MAFKLLAAAPRRLQKLNSPRQICDYYHEYSIALCHCSLKIMPFVLSVLLPMRGEIVRFSGGITLGFLTAAVAAAAVLAMASEHIRLPTPFHMRKAASNSSSNVFTQTYEEEYVLDEEDQILCLLLEAFPGISHETLAVAYARADRDPNKAAEILSAETVTNGNVSAKSSDFLPKWEPPNLEDDKLELDDPFGSSSGNGPKALHSDDFGFREADTYQLKNGHGDFTGASVWRDSPILANHSRPPETSSESFVNPLSPEEDGDRAVSFASQRKNKITRSHKPNLGTRSCSSTPPKLSAVAGSVTNRMLRRPSGSLANGNCSELGDWLNSEKMVKKKNKVGNGMAVEEDRRRAAEDFLHSMLGGDFGLDLVRDVLAHHGGDTEKALETLLNIGSNSSGFDYSLDAVKAVAPLYEGDTEKDLETLMSRDTATAVNPVFSDLSLGAQNGENGEITHPPGDMESDLLIDHEAFVDSLPTQEEQSHRILLRMLIDDFPTVEETSLEQVLQAVEFSYEGVLEILRESGMTPVGLQSAKPKLDPNEVLQALFRTRNEPPTTAGHFDAPATAAPFDEPPETATTEELWSVVAAKPRTSRNTENQAQKLRSNGDGELDQYNEYYRQRASANEHWETMKMYMKEANAAYNRGDRVRAGLLSEKGAKFKEHARAASNRASENIFNVRNKDLPNIITIDLHSQHVAEALSLLQLHLRALSQIPSVNGLTVITGQGSHSAGGQAKIKPAITRYLDKKQVPWTQENPGCIFIKMSDVRSGANQRDMDSYTDSE